MSGSNPLERAFDLLDIVVSANREMTLVEMVQASNLPQSSTFRLASNLVESGMLTFDSRKKTYRAGKRVFRLALFATGQQKLRDTIAPVLEKVATFAEETSFFVIREAQANRLFSYVVPDLGARSFVHPGNSFPIHASSVGKLMAAFLHEDPAFAGSAEPLEQYQAATMTDAEQLRTLFERIRQQGYAVNDSELDPDVYSMSAPVFFSGEIAGALGFVGPRGRINPDDDGHIDTLISRLLQSAAHLSALIAQ